MYFSSRRLFLSYSEQGNNADPDEMQLSAVFHLGLYCLPSIFSGLQYTKGSIIHATNFWNIFASIFS